MTTTPTTSQPPSGRQLTIDQETMYDLRTHGSATQIEGVFDTARDIVARGGKFSVVPDPNVGGDAQHFRHPSDLEDFIAEVNMGRRLDGRSEIPARGAGSLASGPAAPTA